MKRALIPALAFVVACAGLAGAQAPAEERMFVLVVGVEDYADPKITDLGFTEDDAQAVYDFFAKDPRSPTIPARVKLLRGKAATRVAVLRAIRDQLIRRATSPRDTALLYFAGHGFTDADGVYLATQDTQLDDLQYTAVTWAELQRQWSKISAGRRVFLADACHSGGLAGLRGFGGITKGGLGAKQTPSRTSVLIAATGANQLSVEDKRSKHGVFTASLLRGLAGSADANRDGATSLGELAAYLKADVPQLAKRAGGNQVPSVHYKGNAAFAKGLALSRGRARPPAARSTRLARLEAERQAAEKERERAELQARLAEERLKQLKGASAEEKRRAQAAVTRANAEAVRARRAVEGLRLEVQKRAAAEKRAAKAEAENAELRRKLAEARGGKSPASAPKGASVQELLGYALVQAQKQGVLQARLLDERGYVSKKRGSLMLMRGKVRGGKIRLHVIPDAGAAKSRELIYDFDRSGRLEKLGVQEGGEVTWGRVEGGDLVVTSEGGTTKRFPWRLDALPSAFGVLVLPALFDQGLPQRVKFVYFDETRMGSKSAYRESVTLTRGALLKVGQGTNVIYSLAGRQSVEVRVRGSRVSLITLEPKGKDGPVDVLRLLSWVELRDRLAVPRVKADFKALGQAIEHYRLENGGLPGSLQHLVKGSRVLLKRIPLDPWGRSYRYERKGGARYELTSHGADGKPGGLGPNADLLSSKLAD